MRVGVLTTSYPRWAGDPAGQFVAALNRQLVAQGHTVEVVAAGQTAETTGGRSQVEPGIHVERISSTLFYEGGAPDALLSGPQARFAAARFSLALARRFAARQRAFDALVSHWLVPCGVLAAALFHGRPHVAVAHSSDVHLLRRLHLQAAARFVAGRARLIYTSAALRIPGAEGAVLPMGIDCATFAAGDEDRAAARRRYGVQAPTILFLGRLVPVKGVALLLDAVAQLPGVQLWLAGDGPLRPSLERAAAPLADRVHFLGQIEGDERRARLLACDVLAVPSQVLVDGRTEGAPQVVLEGLAAGCLIVASRVGAISDLLGDAGWLVAAGDRSGHESDWPQALSTVLRLSASDPSRALRDAAAKRARRFDWSVLAPQILGPALCRDA